MCSSDLFPSHDNLVFKAPEIFTDLYRFVDVFSQAKKKIKSFNKSNFDLNAFLSISDFGLNSDALDKLSVSVESQNTISDLEKKLLKLQSENNFLESFLHISCQRHM